MTDNTQPEVGSTHIIRYALELGLLWIDGDGRDKVREALAALDALEAKLASIGAGGVQALSAAPEAIAKLRHLYQNMVNGAVRDTASAKRIAEGLLAPAIEALERATPPAEQQAAPKAAPGVGNSGFDHKTAADFLSGKTVSDEAVRKFVQAARWAHDEKASLNAMLLSVRGVLASRNAEIALLKRALMEAEEAPQQEAQEPALFVSAKQLADLVDPSHATGGSYLPARKTRAGLFTQPLYTAPQPAPAPLSDDVSQKTWALLDELEKLRSVNREEEDWDTLNKRDDELRAAIAAQGGTP